MDCRNLLPVINRDSSIPELMKFIKSSFCECEFAEAQNILVNRENSWKVEIENLVKDVEKLENEKWDLKEKLVLSCRKCDEMDERLVKMEKELEELRRENDCANKSIEELNAKEIESDRAVHTINELRVKRMESLSDKDLNTRISMSETVLAEILGVNVKDLASLANAFENCAGAATIRVVMSLEVLAVSGIRDLAHSGTEEDDANRVFTNPGSEPASSNSDVAGNTATVPDNQGGEPVVRGSHTSVMQSDGEVAREMTTVPSSSAAAAAAGNVVIVISDSDDENTLSKKRDRRECGEDSTINCSRKRRRSNYTQPSGLPSSTNVEERQMCRTAGDLVESEDESCSDDHTNNLIAKFKS